MEHKMYNEDLKKEFLSGYDGEATQTTIKYMFYKSYEEERALNKDLCDFNMDELKTVLHNTNPLTKPVARSNGRFISAYIKWAINNGHRKSNINPLSMVTPDWYDQFVDESKKLFLSEQEIDDVIKDLVNDQDKVIVRLLFEGAGGYSSSELLNLHRNDVDFDNNILHLKDDRHGERDIKVSDECMSIIRAALKETEYHQRNGTSQSKNPTVELVDNDFVVKTVKRGNTGVDRADKHTIYRRITMISELFGYPYLNAKNIQRSGMLKMARDVLLDKGKIENEDLSVIAGQFGMRKINMHGYEIYNYSLIRGYINEENINDLYGGDQ